MAYYLLDAGMSKDNTVAEVAYDWSITGGDEDYRFSTDPAGELQYAGVYGVNVADRPADWPNGKPMIVADAAIVAGRYRQADVGALLPATLLSMVDEWVADAAREAVKHPVAGYASPRIAQQQAQPIRYIPKLSDIELPTWR